MTNCNTQVPANEDPRFLSQIRDLKIVSDVLNGSRSGAANDGSGKGCDPRVTSFMALLAGADGVNVDGQTLQSFTTSDPIGKGDNEIVIFSWVDDEFTFEVILTEAGIANGQWKEGVFHCNDHEGDAVQITLHRHQAICPPTEVVDESPQKGAPEAGGSPQVLPTSQALDGWHRTLAVVGIHLYDGFLGSQGLKGLDMDAFQGHVGLTSELSRYATPIAYALLRADALNYDYPGVVMYEVVEPLGAWLRKQPEASYEKFVEEAVATFKSFFNRDCEELRVVLRAAMGLTA